MRPTITALVADFDAKALMIRILLKSYLAGGNRIINIPRQTNRKSHGQIFDKAHGLTFLQVPHLFFSYLCSNKQNTLHVCVTA